MCELSFTIGICFGVLIGIIVNIIMDKWLSWKDELRESYKRRKDD